jgi:methylmalonyl-CoA mutase N-terminal domain/subunit
MKEKFHAKNPLSWKFRFHTQTSGVTLLAQQPENNMVRVALQALASILGGTQSLHTNSRDEALALPSEEAAQIALRTQQIIAHESGVTDTVDPVGGSYFIENLTNQIEKKVKDYFQKIKELGGMLVAIEKGFIQKEIQESAYRYQKQIESNQQIIVGLNKYQDKKEKIHFNLYSPPKEVELTQLKKLRLLKKNRSEQKVNDRLDVLRKAVESEENLLPHIIETVKVKATLGEISSLLREAYGTFNETITL